VSFRRLSYTPGALDALERLELAIETDTDHGVALAIAALITEQLLVRHGEVLTLEVARERANNIALVIAPMVRR
jgi:hypothetical protein